MPSMRARAGAVKVTKTHESTLDVYVFSTAGGDFWIVPADKQVVTDGTTGVTSS